jgi:hypothetical protein
VIRAVRAIRVVIRSIWIIWVIWAIVKGTRTIVLEVLLRLFGLL